MELDLSGLRLPARQKAILGLAILGFTRALAGESLPLPWIGRYDEMVPEPPDIAPR